MFIFSEVSNSADQNLGKHFRRFRSLKLNDQNENNIFFSQQSEVTQKISTRSTGI